jgi:hypothetical protein
VAPPDRVDQRGGVDQLQLEVLDHLGERGGLDWSRASVGVRAKRRDHVGANPVDRGKPGSKLHLVCDGRGLPLTAVVTAANVNDTTTLQAAAGALGAGLGRFFAFVLVACALTCFNRL